MKIISIFITIAFILTFSSGVHAVTKVNLAVLNFYSENNRYEGTGVGFSEILTEKLNKLSDVNVLDRENQRQMLSVMGIDINQKIEPDKIQSIGKILNADYLLTGSVNEKNEDISITYQIFNVTRGTVTGEETITGKKENLFKMEGDIACNVAPLIGSHISETTKKDMYFMQTQNMSSFKTFSRGLTLYENSRINEAYSFFLSSVKSDTGFIEAHKYFEYSARKTGKLDEFIKTYENMLVSDPKNPILLNYLGNAYYDRANLLKSESLYKEAIKSNPDFPNPHCNLGIVYTVSRKYNEALKEFENALKNSDKKDAIYYNMGICYLNMKDMENAKKYFTLALEENPTEPDFVLARYYLFGVKVYVEVKEKQVPEGIFGEIFLNRVPVFEIQDSAGGMTPVERANFIGKRLQLLVNENLKPYEIEVGKMNKEIVIKSAEGKLIMTITKDMANRDGSTVEKLAQHKTDILKDILSTEITVSYSKGGFVLQLFTYKIDRNTIKEINSNKYYKITGKTIETIKGKLDNDRLKIIYSLMHLNIPEEKLSARLSENNFTKEEIEMVLNNSRYIIDTERLASLLDKELSAKDLEEELKKLNYNPEEREIIKKSAMKQDGDDNKTGTEKNIKITGETLEGLKDKVNTDELKVFVNKEVSVKDLQKNLKASNLKAEEIETTLNFMMEKEMTGTSPEANYLHIGDRYYSEGRIKEALEEYNKALKINPNFPPANLCLGVISCEKKDYQKAALFLDKAIKNNPDYFDAYLWMGKVCLAQDKKGEAKNFFKKALELKPGNTEVQGYMLQ